MLRKETGEFRGRGIDVITGLMKGSGGYITSKLRVEKQGRVVWKIRNHKNHFEALTSEYIVARR